MNKYVYTSFSLRNHCPGMILELTILGHLLAGLRRRSFCFIRRFGGQSLDKDKHFGSFINVTCISIQLVIFHSQFFYSDFDQF